jgi:hypothetical protein
MVDAKRRGRQTSGKAAQVESNDQGNPGGHAKSVALRMKSYRWYSD